MAKYFFNFGDVESYLNLGGQAVMWRAQSAPSYWDRTDLQKPGLAIAHPVQPISYLPAFQTIPKMKSSVTNYFIMTVIIEKAFGDLANVILIFYLGSENCWNQRKFKIGLDSFLVSKLKLDWSSTYSKFHDERSLWGFSKSSTEFNLIILSTGNSGSSHFQNN